MIKAVFFDIDGTLLSHQTNRIPPSALEAMDRLRGRGIKVFLATGRHCTMLEREPQLRQLRYDGAVTLNGAYCYDQSGVLYSHPICREDIDILLDYLEKTPRPCAFLESGSWYINLHNDLVRQVHNFLESPLPELGDLNRGKIHPVYQALVYLPKDRIPDLPHLPHCSINPWYSDGVDIYPSTAGKSAGIQAVLDHYGIRTEETMAFGDGDNDLGMFRLVGTAVAMGGARDHVKAAADFVTKTVDEDGIAHALAHFGLIEPRK